MSGADGRRPGGLTALAVLNFVGGGFLALVVLASAIGVAAMNSMDSSEARELQETIRSHPIEFWTSFGLMGLNVVLLIASGVGYLGQKRFSGRTLGNVYAIASIAQTGISLTTSQFGIAALIGLVYPVLTLALINTTFKDDLVN